MAETTRETTNLQIADDPALHVVTISGRIIPSAEYYDAALAGCLDDDPYIQMSTLEEAMACRRHRGHARTDTGGDILRDTELFIRRPVVPSDNLVSVLQEVAPFHNPKRGTRCHKPGTAVQNSLHTTLLNTRGIRDLELPNSNLLDSTLQEPSLGKRLGKMSIEGVEIFKGSSNYHVVLLYGHRSLAKLRDERERLESTHFPRLCLGITAASHIFRPHVTILSTSDQTTAEQALETVSSRAKMPKSIELAPAKFSQYTTLYADTPIQRA